jgi:hypothetical protein
MRSVIDMERSFYTRFVLLDRERDRRSYAPAAGKDRPAPGERALVCAACGNPITDEESRIVMAGSHEHTFVNPGGFAYTIGCFSNAPGCVPRGAPDDMFSWFPGWSWQVATCGSCRAHVGWLYRNAGEAFHGLILAALRESN